MIRLACAHELGVSPRWAVLERRLLDDLDSAVWPFMDRYVEPDGSLTWCGRLNGTGSADDFYEPFYNWPLVYLLGGGDHLLALAKRQWRAITAQLDSLGAIENGFIKSGDWFHLGETYIYFYLLCLADPQDVELVELARSFAGLYVGDDAPNLDAERMLIRSPHTGGAGPTYALGGSAVFGWYEEMRPYGLPLQDVPGIATYDDLKNPELAARMGQAMATRMGRGDAAQNLAAAGLVGNAFLLTGDRRYRDWITAYVGAWRERADRNGGILPDNVGPSGEVGEDHGGRWYGSIYGWTWPHGFYNLQTAAAVAATTAALVDADPDHLVLARAQLDRITAMGSMRTLEGLSGSYGGNALGEEVLAEGQGTLVAPFRHGPDGWFDEQPLLPKDPVALWNASESPDDWARILALRPRTGYDWRTVDRSRTARDNGHEAPWIAYLQGDNPTYPEGILAAGVDSVAERCEQIAVDTIDLTTVADKDLDFVVHHWQNMNPITTEALVQLTLGAPQFIYNGGLLIAPVRYFDARRRRPGLPPSVAALVEGRGEGWIRLALVNLDESSVRETVIAAGALGENRFTSVRCIAHEPSTDGLGSDHGPCADGTTGSGEHGERWASVSLAPRSWTRLELRYDRHVTPARATVPWASVPEE